MRASNDPSLSVVVASYNSAAHVEKCLESLAGQTTNKDFEVILVDSSDDRTAEIVASKFPAVRLYTFPERKFCGSARNFGISVARGDILAFTDADCAVAPDWVEQVLKAHESAHQAVAGCIASSVPCNYVAWAAYFSEFSQWMPDRRPREVADAAGANVSYKRTILEEFGPFIDGTYCSDSELHWRLRKRGYRLRLVPSIAVSHRSLDKLGEFVRHQFKHGRCFGQVRARCMGFSRLRRAVCVALFWLLPFWLFLKVGLRNMRNPVYLVHFVKSAPLVLVGLTFWALGECVGYVGGAILEKGH